MLKKENRELLCALLEAAGRREAANMMRGPAAKTEAPKVDAKPKKPAKEALGIGWRSIQKHLMSLTRPDVTSKDSVEELERKVEASK